MNLPRPSAADLRPLAPWLVLAASVMALELFLDVGLGITYNRLVVDQAELSVEVGAMDGLVTSIGVVLLAAATAVTWFTASIVGRGAVLWAPLVAIGAETALLAADDRLRGHEGLSNVTGAPEVLFLAVHVVVVGLIAWRWGRLLVPEWPLAALFLVGFGGSLALDEIVETILGLEFPGEVFLEENLKLLGICAILGLATRLGRRALAVRAATS